MTGDFQWTEHLALDVRFGYLGSSVIAPRRHNPQLILNDANETALRILREELGECIGFTFSVAFVTPGAIALIKQELVEFAGEGQIITSDYLGFNSPQAFAELQNLRAIGIDVRIHSAPAFHPKGYIFEHRDSVTAMVGSSNLTKAALATNHEWNLKVSAAHGSDLAAQLSRLALNQIEGSTPITEDWIAAYAESYRVPAPRPPRASFPAIASPPSEPNQIAPNLMQSSALEAIQQVRLDGKRRAIIISATGTGKTILSALDVRAFSPKRLLFVVHREQILDRTISEYMRVLGGPPADYGKLTGNTKQQHRKYLFATVQTVSQPAVLDAFDADEFDYVIIDEAHRSGAASYQRLFDHFTPKFLLGMTATPERTDGFNVFELFDFNVPYEIPLNRALEEEMLSPFHYYGVADVIFADGRAGTTEADLQVLISIERVNHLLKTIEVYGQVGVPVRGLIFCSRKDEAAALAAALNQARVHGRPLRTVALTGDDSIVEREAAVEQLERGELDYILTVDIFNEGVDIPAVNQVIMLRQTQSSIVFVQQLGRGLRKADGKEYLVVIDFIGNYANNYLIPIALFGDDSLNKESLRQKLISAEESGVLPGLSSVRFDRISQERVLSSITTTKLDSLQNLKAALELMRNRTGQIPQLADFLRFESVDPVLLATKLENYPALVKKLLKVETGLSEHESKALGVVSHEVLPAKRLHELVLLQTLLDRESVTKDQLVDAFLASSLPVSPVLIESAIDSLTLEQHGETDQTRYGAGIARRQGPDVVSLTPECMAAYQGDPAFTSAIDDLIATGLTLIPARYSSDAPFTSGCQYSRKDAARLLGWPRKWTSTIYGYRVDQKTRSCPIFVTLHKSDEITASTAYADELIDRGTMRWYTRSRRNMQSDEVRSIVANDVDLHVFVKKDDAEGTDFYYLGQASSQEAEQTTMPGANDASLDVVRMLLRFDQPIDSALYDYFHPVVTV